MFKVVRAFELIPALRVWPEYQLSADINSHKAGTKYPDKLPQYLVKPRFFLNQLLLVMRSRGEPLAITCKASFKVLTR